MDGPAFAFLAACAFALGTVLQQRGTLGTTSGSGDSHWLIQILYKPVLIIASAVVGFVLQQSALKTGVLARAEGPMVNETAPGDGVPTPAPAA